MSILDNGQFRELNTNVPINEIRLFAPHEIDGLLEQLNGRFQSAMMNNDPQQRLAVEMAIQYCHLYESIQKEIVTKQEMVQTTVNHLVSLNAQLQNLLTSMQIDPQPLPRESQLMHPVQNWDQVEQWLAKEKQVSATEEPAHTDRFEETAVVPEIIIYCLGNFRLFHQHQQIKEINGIKGQLFKYLLLNREKPISKEKLIDIFWPDADIEAARRNLHQAVYQLRQLLRKIQPEKKVILFEDDHYRLNPELAIQLDVVSFMNHVENGHFLLQNGQIEEGMKQYSIAELMYQGQFLEDLPYDDWPRFQRQQLHAHYQTVTTQLIAYYLEQQSFTAVIALCQKRLQFESCDEFAHQQLMQCYLSQGQRHMAIRQYQRCANALNEELGLLPSSETEALYLEAIQ